MPIGLQRGRRARRARLARDPAMSTPSAGDGRAMLRRSASGEPPVQPHLQDPAGKPGRTRTRSHLQAAQEAARERQLALARALHDDLGQLIALAQMRLSQLALTPLSAQASRLVAQLHALMAQSSASLRKTCFSIVRSGEATVELAVAIERHCRELAESFDQQIVFRSEGERPALPPSTEAVVLRASRELIVNACKHAHARRIDAHLRCEAGELRFEVIDDGLGIAAAASGGEATGFGLASIRHQLDALGARLSIDARPSGGTLCRLQLPLQFTSPNGHL